MYQRFKIIWKYILKKNEAVSDNPSIMIYVNKIENRITFKINTEYYLQLLTPEAMKLLGSTKCMINKDKNGENVPHLEITKAVQIHCNIVNNDYQQNSIILCTFVPNKSFGQFGQFHLKTLFFLKTSNQNLIFVYWSIVYWSKF